MRSYSKAWIISMILIVMLIVLVGCEDEKEAIDVEPALHAEPVIEKSEQQPSILPINYESYGQTRRLVNKELDLLAWPNSDGQLVNELLPGTLVGIEYAATSDDGVLWLFVTIPTYDCPCNNRGWIKEMDTEEITEENRINANNGIAIYIGTMVYEGFEFDSKALGEPAMIERSTRGMITEVRDDYARIITGGGGVFWVKKEDIGFPIPDTKRPSVNNYLRNIDSLLKAFSSVHDTAVGLTYEDEELLALAEHPLHKTYESTLEYYVGSELHKEIKSYRTISKTVNPRTLLVIMSDDSIYQITVEMRHKPDLFWVVTSYMDFYVNGNVKVKQQYEFKSIVDVPDEPKLWAEKLLQEEAWATDYKTFAGKTYILIKSSSDNFDSVELDYLELSDGAVTVGYQLYEHRRPELVQDYMLIEAEFGEINEVNYVETYRSLE